MFLLCSFEQQIIFQQIIFQKQNLCKSWMFTDDFYLCSHFDQELMDHFSFGWSNLKIQGC